MKVQKGVNAMLTEERYATILRILKEKQAVTVPELTRALCTSESTIRRDLTALHKRGMLYKVYGGATSIDSNYTAMEEDMPTKSSRCTEEKIAIARRAASLVTRKDFVYIDAGSTTLHMVDFLQERQAVAGTSSGLHHGRPVLPRHVSMPGQTAGCQDGIGTYI